jgi:putative FmdB family regulatory protein
MPLYEFECEACKTRFDRIQKYTDPNPEVCPVCGKGPIRKMPSSPAIQFKGSGFYITDYAKKSSSEAGSKSGSASSESSASTSSTSSSGDTASKTSESTTKTSEKTSDKSSEKKD